MALRRHTSLYAHYKNESTICYIPWRCAVFATFLTGDFFHLVVWIYIHIRPNRFYNPIKGLGSLASDNCATHRFEIFQIRAHAELRDTWLRCSSTNRWGWVVCLTWNFKRHVKIWMGNLRKLVEICQEHFFSFCFRTKINFEFYHLIIGIFSDVQNWSRGWEKKNVCFL